MRHILTDWRISNCGAKARRMAPHVEGGITDAGKVGLFTIPVNGFGPEVQIISSGMEFDVESLGGEKFFNSPLFMAGSGSGDVHSMQYFHNWEDADGSMTRRGVPTVLGPSRAGSWWHLDFRKGRCEVRDKWQNPEILCDKGTRHLGHHWLVAVPGQGTKWDKGYPNPGGKSRYRYERQGSVTHFGLKGQADVNEQCDPPAQCGETTSRSWDPDLTGGCRGHALLREREQCAVMTRSTKHSTFASF